MKQWFRLNKALGRVRNFFAGAIAFLTIKMEYNGGHLDEGQGVNFHFPSSALSHIQGASAATKVVYKTAANDPSPVTAQAKPTGDSQGPLSISNGKIQIELSTDESAKALNEELKKGKCEAAPKPDSGLEKRLDDDVVDCLVNDFRDILENMRDGGALNELREQALQVAPNFPLPNFENEQYQAAFAQALVLADRRMPQVLGNVNRNRIRSGSIYLFMITLARFLEVFVERRVLVVEIHFSADYHLTCPNKNSMWFPNCESYICQGKEGRCTTMALSSCSCNAAEERQCRTDKKVFTC